jgi:hypothetical protein
MQLERRDSAGPRLLLTSKQAAQALSVSPRTLWDLTRRGELKPLRLPGRGVAARALRYSVEDLQNWIRRTTEAEPAQANGRPE